MGVAVNLQAREDAPLARLLQAGASRAVCQGYAGEVTCTEAYEFLQQEPRSLLIDVRTRPEWQFVGLPDLSSARGKLATISWKNYPTFALNTEFERQLLDEAVDFDAVLFFICRSGGRSLDAAMAMTQAGYRYCFNVLEGFEGEPDAASHRGVRGGWKASGLPWLQG